MMAGMTVLVVAIGGAVGGRSGTMIAIALAFGINFFTYWFSDKMAIKATRSVPLTEEEAPEIYEMVRELTGRAGIPMPKLFRTPDPQPNAFATGRNYDHSALAVTDGILRILDKRELRGVLAHEVAHIKNRDILIGSMAAAFAGAIMFIADMLRWAMMFGGGDRDRGPIGLVGMIAISIIGPIAAMVVQMAISRSREYAADATGAELAQDPHSLANALLKLESTAKMMPMEVSPAASHLFIVKPFSVQGIGRLFSTHPPIEERVRRLREYAQ